MLISFGVLSFPDYMACVCLTRVLVLLTTRTTSQGHDRARSAGHLGHLLAHVILGQLHRQGVCSHGKVRKLHYSSAMRARHLLSSGLADSDLSHECGTSTHPCSHHEAPDS